MKPLKRYNNPYFAKSIKEIAGIDFPALLLDQLIQFLLERLIIIAGYGASCSKHSTVQLSTLDKIVDIYIGPVESFEGTILDYARQTMIEYLNKNAKSKPIISINQVTKFFRKFSRGYRLCSSGPIYLAAIIEFIVKRISGKMQNLGTSDPLEVIANDRYLVLPYFSLIVKSGVSPFIDTNNYTKTHILNDLYDPVKVVKAHIPNLPFIKDIYWIHYQVSLVIEKILKDMRVMRDLRDPTSRINMQDLKKIMILCGSRDFTTKAGEIIFFTNSIVINTYVQKFADFCIDNIESGIESFFKVRSRPNIYSICTDASEQVKCTIHSLFEYTLVSYVDKLIEVSKQKNE